jgi:hypothetical protein
MRAAGWPSLLLATILAAGAAPVAGQQAKPVDPLCERVLPASAAGRLTGRTDLVLVGKRAVTGAGGTCNYAAAGKMVFLVTVLDEKSRAAEAYARYKGQAAYLTRQREVAGLGDAGFTAGAYEHELVARKGSRVLLLGSMLLIDHATHQAHAAVTREQLVAIAREVLARL